MIDSSFSMDGEVLTLKFEGDLTSSTYEVEFEGIQKIFDDPAYQQAAYKRLVLDMLGVRRIDSSGVNLVVNLLHKMQQRGCSVRCALASRMVYQTFLFTRLDKRMEIVFMDKSLNTGSAMEAKAEIKHKKESQSPDDE
jgi:anti-anti-sigma factor